MTTVQKESGSESSGFGLLTFFKPTLFLMISVSMTVISEDYIFLSSDGYVVNVDARSGSMNWQLWTKSGWEVGNSSVRASSKHAKSSFADLD
jgi:hypothetical protein